MNDLEVRLRRLQDDYPDPRPGQPMETTLLGPVTLEGAAPVRRTTQRRRRALLVPAFVVVALIGGVAIAALRPTSSRPAADEPAVQLVPGPPMPIPAEAPGPPAIFHWVFSTEQGGATLTNERWLATGPDLLSRGAYPAIGETGGSVEYGNCVREASSNETTGSSEIYDAKANTITSYPPTSTSAADVVRGSDPTMARALLAASRLPASTPANGTLDGKPMILIDGWTEPGSDSVFGFYLDPVTHHPITHYRRSPTDAPVPIPSEGQRFTSYEILPVTPENLKLFDLHVQHPTARDAAKPATDCPAG